MSEPLYTSDQVKVLHERITWVQKQLRKCQDRLGRSRASNRRLRDELDGAVMYQHVAFGLYRKV